MTNWLIKTFIKNSDNVKDTAVRSAYGKFSGIVGIIANILLFVAKVIAGALLGAISVIADAFNNLSDAASSIVTLLGFKLSEAPPDEKHPFGHGRMEYLSSMALGILILFAGFELGRSSIAKIFSPEKTNFQVVSIVILVLAIFVKFWLAYFYGKIGKLIQSDTVLAASLDSRNDTICTSVVIISAFVEHFTGLQIDGYVGTCVAIFVAWTGVTVILQGVSPLLGQAPDPELIEEIKETAMSYESVVGVHDIMVHNYGPGRVTISLHAEVPASQDVLVSHDIMDQIEVGMMQKFKAVTCVHMDPVDLDNPETAKLKEIVQKIIEQLDPALNMHDFRVVYGETHTNLIFDLVVPFNYSDEEDIYQKIQDKVSEYDPKIYIVTQIEHQYY